MAWLYIIGVIVNVGALLLFLPAVLTALGALGALGGR